MQNSEFSLGSGRSGGKWRLSALIMPIPNNARKFHEKVR
jgi:hypothetical protein